MAAVYSLKVFDLDEVWFVPTYRHPFLKRSAPFSTRVRWCKKLISNLGPRFRVSTIERELKGDGKTLHTLMALKRRFPKKQFRLIIGSDLLRERRSWYRFPEIERRFGVLIVPRKGSSKSPFALPNVSSSEVRRRLRSKKSLADLLTPAVARTLRS